MSIALVYETHSVSEDNERGIATGWLDGRLSTRGQQLAVELGERRRHDGIAVVLTSDLGRAVETATIAFDGSGLAVIQDSRLRECNYGEWNGMTVARLEAERMRHLDDPFPGGESYRQVVTRVAAFLTDLSATWDGARVLVIGHAATHYVLDHLLTGVPLEQAVAAPFEWQAGWSYTLPSRWKRS